MKHKTLFSRLKNKLRLFFIPGLIILNSLNAQPTLIGTNGRGGYDFGTVFSYQAGAGSLSNVYKLQGTNIGTGGQHIKLIEAGGKLWGMTVNGGAYSTGVLFS